MYLVKKTTKHPTKRIFSFHKTHTRMCRYHYCCFVIVVQLMLWWPAASVDLCGHVLKNKWLRNWYDFDRRQKHPQYCRTVKQEMFVQSDTETLEVKEKCCCLVQSVSFSTTCLFTLSTHTHTHECVWIVLCLKSYFSLTIRELFFKHLCNICAEPHSLNLDCGFTGNLFSTVWIFGVLEKIQPFKNIYIFFFTVLKELSSQVLN